MKHQDIAAPGTPRGVRLEGVQGAKAPRRSAG